MMRSAFVVLALVWLGVSFLVLRGIALIMNLER